MEVLKPVKGIKSNNRDSLISNSNNISELINKYSLHLIKTGGKNPLYILSELIRKNDRGFILDILDSDKKEIYDYAVQLYSDKPFKLKHSKDGVDYHIVCDIRLLMLVVLSLDYHEREEDYNFLCFRAMLQYLQLDKKLRGSVYKLLYTI